MSNVVIPHPYRIAQIQYTYDKNGKEIKQTMVSVLSDFTENSSSSDVLTLIMFDGSRHKVGFGECAALLSEIISQPTSKVEAVVRGQNLRAKLFIDSNGVARRDAVQRRYLVPILSCAYARIRNATAEKRVNLQERIQERNMVPA